MRQIHAAAVAVAAVDDDDDDGARQLFCRCLSALFVARGRNSSCPRRAKEREREIGERLAAALARCSKRRLESAQLTSTSVAECGGNSKRLEKVTLWCAANELIFPFSSRAHTATTLPTVSLVSSRRSKTGRRNVFKPAGHLNRERAPVRRPASCLSGHRVGC